MTSSRRSSLSSPHSAARSSSYGARSSATVVSSAVTRMRRRRMRSSAGRDACTLERESATCRRGCDTSSATARTHGPVDAPPHRGTIWVKARLPPTGRRGRPARRATEVNGLRCRDDDVVGPSGQDLLGEADRILLGRGGAVRACPARVGRFAILWIDPGDHGERGWRCHRCLRGSSGRPGETLPPGTDGCMVHARWRASVRVRVRATHRPSIMSIHGGSPWMRKAVTRPVASV